MQLSQIEQSSRVVEQILEKRTLKGKKIEYLIQWINCSKDSWESADNLEGVEDTINQFEMELKAKNEKEIKILGKNQDMNVNQNESNGFQGNDKKATNLDQVKATNRDDEEQSNIKNDVKVEEYNNLNANNKVQSTQHDMKVENVRKKNTEKSKPLFIEDDVYNIEALIEKKESNYLVKWENYPEDQNTWEPKSSIPHFIIKVEKAIQSICIYNVIQTHNFSIMKKT